MINHPLVKELENGFLFNAALNVEKISTITSPNVISLRELCLRKSKINKNLWITQELMRILEFPSAICECSKSLFTEVYMTIFHENRMNFDVPFYRFFCTKKCLKLFRDRNIKNCEFIL
jgi:hypothetical protein